MDEHHYREILAKNLKEAVIALRRLFATVNVSKVNNVVTHHANKMNQNNQIMN